MCREESSPIDIEVRGKRIKSLSLGPSEKEEKGDLCWGGRDRIFRGSP